MSKPDIYPARLYVILAREASKGVILRRVPSGWVRTILWHTDSDEFEGGQWLRGRIYGERCGLSPDGSLFVYFAAQHHKPRDGYLGTWTAISKPPYLTALALWPKGDTWGGGGRFIDNQTVLLHHNGAEARPNHLPPNHLRVISDALQMKDLDQTMINQIAAVDWQVVHRPDAPTDLHSYGRRTKDPTIWHRAHPTNDRYYLVRRYYGYIPRNYPQPSIIEYAVGDRIIGTETPLSAANWADWDHRGRLVFTQDGQIFAQHVEQIGTFIHPLADFNDQVFENVLTPDWAKRW